MRVLVADDHPLFRTALQTAVRRAEPAAEVFEAGTVAEALATLKAHRVDLALLDLAMSDAQAMSGLMALRASHPDVPVIVVSAHEDTQTIQRARACGAAHYVSKSAPLDHVVQAIRGVLMGDTAPLPEGEALAANDPAARVASLTPAQLRVLMGIAEGRLNKQIAYDMNISEATVKAHVTAIFRKLQVVNRTQALLAAKDVLLAPVG